MWKIIFTTFWIVFLAELGDKTQLSTMLLASKTKSGLSVFIGAASALILSSVIGVLCGEILSRYIPQNYIQIGAGISFIAIGLLLLFGKF
ncbi:TMEM165/GDT1 family protein [Petroclostridium sp. X23]|jgi:putative Ca2+/H+ antiporter (TMEM165/GDT1 family)|uniref:TMEM165/GDT1 family protein n=1 Tax=Petroclostridium sp. X23 TaxID=3045146 RepID=UPI0024ACF0A3|nr:TMEM165/GDT1 family protein [Petroclostridium sp. X23]WHH57257.1 TMEM165/GDT1 family protein [Petroclostridium sp. X23]